MPPTVLQVNNTFFPFDDRLQFATMLYQFVRPSVRLSDILVICDHAFQPIKTVSVVRLTKGKFGSDQSLLTCTKPMVSVHSRHNYKSSVLVTSVNSKDRSMYFQSPDGTNIRVVPFTSSSLHF